MVHFCKFSFVRFAFIPRNKACSRTIICHVLDRLLKLVRERFFRFSVSFLYSLEDLCRTGSRKPRRVTEWSSTRYPKRNRIIRRNSHRFESWPFRFSVKMRTFARAWTILLVMKLSYAGKSVDVLTSSSLNALEDEEILRVLSRNESTSANNFTLVELIDNWRNHTTHTEATWRAKELDVRTNPFYSEFFCQDN